MLKARLQPIILSLSFFILLASCNKPGNHDTGPSIIPKPESVINKKGYFNADKELVIKYSDQKLVPVLNTFKDQLGGKINVIPLQNGPGNVEVIIDTSLNMGVESYSLEIGRKMIILKAPSLKAVFYGLQTLRQMIMFAEEPGEISLQCCTIEDSPLFPWRGVMIDESRHFFGKEKIMQLLDIMALHKLDVFHWHLTDSPGWRIEIKKYPALTEIGGIGNHTNPSAPASFYTQEDIKEIIIFASARFIEVIPEIDMPGHATAANRAYPEFSGGGSERYPEWTFNPGKEGTYAYLTNILREVSGLFPSKYIHTGGDEVSFGNHQWPDLPDVKRLMKKEGLKDLKAVETYFNKRISDSVISLGKKVIGWDEIVDADMNPETSVAMWWRHDKPAQLLKALEKNYTVVLCPRIPLYFDFVQHESHEDGRIWNKIFCPLESVYNFPPDSLPGFKQYKDQILGLQANLWTERIHTMDRFDFMLYPRISALAEAAWTKKENRSYDDFLTRLKYMLSYFDSLKIRYFNPFDTELVPEPEPAKNLKD